MTLLLAGCYPVMTNEEIIAEHAKCAAAGLDGAQLVNRYSNRTIAVECRPEKRVAK